MSSPRWLLLLLCACCSCLAAPAAATQQQTLPGAAAAGAGGSQHRPRELLQASETSDLPTWRTHYLLANSTVPLEPCSADRMPRAWTASGGSSGAAQGSWQLPGTAAMQAAIYAHQHPVDCSSAKFLVYQAPGHLGMGAMIDFLADWLSRAMTEGRVLLLDFPSHWTRGDSSGGHTSYCHGGALALDECYFEPVSSCSLRDVYSPDVVAAWRSKQDVGTLHEARVKLHGDRIQFSALIAESTWSKVPPQAIPHMNSILHGVKIGGVVSELFWWRAQGVVYVCRLNARTLQVVHELKHKFFQAQAIRPGTVSVHIRRGDKSSRRGGEMGFVPDDVFMSYMRALLASSPDLLKPVAFVSTEDPTALQAIVSNMTDWKVQFTTVPRNNHEGRQPFAQAPTVEALRAFLNLDLALECDGWVGTLGSLWSTLIERLRSTVRCKADRPYTDAHGTLAGLGSVR